ncbi:Rrf2 family transcriptional regulator [Ramlibacter sp. XY19]|uniref:RrF2 family transcriptional regulator n=1 Tax=Ramlibacter paludis TaxID=2908000 RepID=UPI0023DB7460|nr:Rrf2 family transcriptional regulator [Ramlibacter paludis]MCG2595820.1 Rrf2 family transcriptional regulator [Ramlibacter paludis]
MKLTLFTDYSMRVLIYLAARPGERATIAQVAGAYGISEHHLVKVVHFLGQAGWLRNVRGKGGGLELAQEPDQIVLGEVVRATEGEAAVAECFGPDHGNCCIEPACRLRGVLREAVAAFEAVLDRYTLADVSGNRKQLAQLLFFPRAA